jgi:hypothetical protein
MSATDRLIALLEQANASDPGVRQLTASLRHTPQALVERFDHYQRLVEAVGAEEVARIVVDAIRAASHGSLPE